MSKLLILTIFLFITAVILPQGGGQLDNTFGINGKVVTNITPSYDEYGYSTIIQPDGKIIVAGYAYNGPSSNANFNVVRYNEDGTLDKTFGAAGRVTTDFSTSQDFINSSSAVAIQTDGKIIVAGTSGVSDNNFAVVRYNSDGTLDTTFGGIGKGKVTTDFGSTIDYGNTVAIQENGKIIVGGYAYDGFNIGFAMARYNSDGSLDNTFDADGKVITAFGYGIAALKIQEDGRIIGVGYYFSGSNNDFAVARYNPDGSLDGTFDFGGADGINGIAVVDFGGFSDYPTSVAIQNDGKIVIGGYSHNGTSNDFAIARFNTDGSLDLDFGSNGRVKTDFESSVNSDDYGNSILIQPDQKIVIAGLSYISTDEDFTLIRYNADGTPDNDFGEAGKVSIDFANKDDDAYSAALQTDLKIVLAGRTSTSFSGNDFAVSRINSNGDLDNLFGFEGKVTTDLGNSNDLLNDLALQQDGKILAAGISIGGDHSNMAVARYNPDGTIDTSFNTDGRIINDLGYHSFGNSVAVLPDNKILVAGYANSSSNNNFLVSRFNPDGTLDNTFPGGGNDEKDITGTSDIANSIAIQTNGKMLIAGYTAAAGDNDFTVLRYNTDGSLDMAFDNVDNDGVVRTDISGGSNDIINFIAIQSDGKIVAAGSTRSGTNTDYAVVRYNINGSLDNSFDTDGIVTTDFESTNDIGSTVLIQPVDNKIIVAGYSFIDSIFQISIARYNPDGSLDNTFGDNGKAVASVGPSLGLKTSAVLQQDGKIIAGRNFSNGNNYDFALIRFNANGERDNTFGINGKVAIDFEGRQDYNFSAALQPDGKVIAAGASSDGFSLDFALARYNALFPIISLSANELQFGNIKVDSSSSKNFYISNSGSAPCTIDSIVNKEIVFSVNAGELTIPEGDSIEVIITFSPNTEGSSSDTLIIYTNASVDPYIVVLSGNGTSETTAPRIALSALAIVFPEITVNSSLSRSVFIRNNGNAVLQVSGITSDNSAFVIDTANFSVQPGDSQKVTVTFTPTEAINYNAILTITHNASGNPITLNLSGTGVNNPVAIFSLSASVINFPSVTVNSSLQRSFYIGNEGTADLVISNISINDTSFKTASTNFTIPPGDSQQVIITFTPSEAKNYNAILTIQHNANGSPASVNLTGNGNANPVAIFAISKTTLTFGTLITGSSTSQFFYIKNEGVANLEVTQITSSDNAFSVDTANFAVLPGDSIKVTVTFRPVQGKIYSGSLSIQHNAVGSLNTVSLSGTGFSYPATISLSVSKSFGSVDNTNNFRIIGIPGNASIQVQLSGDFDYDWSVYWDNGNGQNYLEHRSDFTFTPGKAYWVIGKNPLAINQQVNSVPLSSSDYSYSIPLHQGWNLISTPFERSTQWASIRNLNSLPANKLLYSWNGSWTNPSEMKPNEGYYYYNDSTNLPALKIPYEASGTLGKQDDLLYPVDKKKFLNLSVLGLNSTESSQIFIGTDPSSNDEVDEKDYYSPPSDFQRESINLLRSELPEREKYLFIEQRPTIGEGQEYSVEIKAIPNQPLEIYCNGIENFNNYEIYLFDSRLKNLYNMKEKQKVLLKSAHQFNPFKLFIGTEDYIDEMKKSLLPLAHQLYQNYPNPFNPKTIIRFSLPETERISLRVFNILGEHISTLIDNEILDAGSYELEFNGSGLASGVYILGIETPKFNAQKKMMLLK
jgi:uncharacterized delta-60 repeat protein